MVLIRAVVYRVLKKKKIANGDFSPSPDDKV